MRVRTILFITALLLSHSILWPQALTKQLPPAQQSQPISADATPEGGNAAADAPAAAAPNSLPDAPGYPIAEVVPAPPSGVPVRFEYDRMEKHGNVYTLTGDVTIDYKNYTLRADKIVFDEDTGDADAEGHLQLQGGPDNELITADHGTMNFNLQTGHFFNVVGSIGIGATKEKKRKNVYTTDNPFLFTGRVVIKEGPLHYRIIEGSMTSCRLPNPDWRILSGAISVNEGEARAQNAYFKLFNVPIFYLPYVTHPVDTESRQSGMLIPIIGNSSTKGFVLGEDIYWKINRSMDATFGTQYFSKRGWSPNGELRYHGHGEDFASFRLTALFDRGLPPNNLNQGGQDILFSGRHDFDAEDHTRAVATTEYLSSYVYRQAFAESFALAVASQVTSSAFLTHNQNGFSTSADFERYQNFQGVTQVGNTYITPQIQILHLPRLDFNTVERSLEESPLVWSFDSSIAGVNRTEPNFNSGETGRFDFYPHLSMPVHLGSWTFRPEVGARETFYTQGQIPTGTTPIESKASVNRKDLEASFELRPPVLVRDFNMPWLERFLGSDVRHTLEPNIQYRYVAGINNFPSIPRFDSTDVVSDTNELDYSLTQRLFLKHLHPQACKNGELPPAQNGVITVPSDYRECGGDTDAWITWTVAAKYFFDPTFGGAVTFGRRNVITPALDLTGVAFLEGPRNYSPIISRLKVRTNERMDVEWDLDYDTKAGRLNSSNIFADYRRGSLFGSVGYSTLQALNATFTDTAKDVTKYNLLRLLLGFGNSTKPGLSAGADAGYDFTENALQYYGAQTSYNWDCCGVSVEYRRFALGSLRNEGEPIFSFTLAGVGAAGNLKRAEKIF